MLIINKFNKLLYLWRKHEFVFFDKCMWIPEIIKIKMKENTTKSAVKLNSTTQIGLIMLYVFSGCV